MFRKNRECRCLDDKKLKESVNTNIEIVNAKTNAENDWKIFMYILCKGI